MCDYAAFRVRAAFCAAALRARLPRCAALFDACLEIARWLAEDLGSRFNAPDVARERVRDVLRSAFRPAAESWAALLRTEDEPLGVPSFTPARRAFESPIAMACLVERAPCFPSR